MYASGPRPLVERLRVSLRIGRACWWVLVCVAAGVAPRQAAATDAAKRCAVDDDCAVGRMCRRGACHLRECDDDVDCHISRRCEEGLCALPDPTRRRGMAAQSPTAPPPEALDGDDAVTVGPLFPGGLLAELALGVGRGRSLVFGLGTTTDAGGLAFRAGFRAFRGRLGPLRRDAWAGLHGFFGGGAEAGSWAATAMGSARRFFASGPSVRALWWAVGAGIELPHGERERRVLRLELGLAMLARGVYRAETDVALLPVFGLRYGIRF